MSDYRFVSRVDSRDETLPDSLEAARCESIHIETFLGDGRVLRFGNHQDATGGVEGVEQHNAGLPEPALCCERERALANA